MSYNNNFKEQEQKEEFEEIERKHEQRRIKFDPTINLGHVISFVIFIASGIITYNALDKRVLVLETSVSKQDLRDLNQDLDRARINAELKDSFNELRHSTERVNDKLDKITENTKH